MDIVQLLLNAGATVTDKNAVTITQPIKCFLFLFLFSLQTFCVSVDVMFCEMASIFLTLFLFCIVFIVQDNRTALMLAAMYGRVEIVQLLLNVGASVNDKERHVQNQYYFSLFCQRTANYIDDNRQVE